MHDHVTDRAVGRSRTARPTEAGIDAVSPRHALRASLRRPLALALGLALFCFGGSAAWSTLAPLASAAVASGTISPEGHRRTVQHLEGGIVREILVADGDRVETGQPLLVLDDLQALARYRMQQARLVALGALAARLRAEESSAAQVDWSVVPDGPDRAEAIADQQAIFAAGLATRAS